jgi:hypothetical protein
MAAPRFLYHALRSQSRLTWVAAAYAGTQVRQKCAQIARHGETAGFNKHRLGKITGQHAGGLCPSLDARFGIVWRVADHDRLRTGETKLA